VRVGVAFEGAAGGERVDERKQGERLAELLARAPEDLTAEGHRLKAGRAHQLGLANARFALYEQGPTTAGGQVGDMRTNLLRL